MVQVLLLLAGALGVPQARAAGVVSPCTDASLNAALVGGGAVTFACSGTITLTGTKIISLNTTIDATGQSVTISGNNTVQMFFVNAGISATFTNFTFAAGRSSTEGGAIANDGELAITNSTFIGNLAQATFGSGRGGAIYNVGTVTIANSTFSGNSAAGGGGSIASFGTATITNSNFTGNSFGSGLGSAISQNAGTLTIRNSILLAGRCGGTITDGGYNLSADASCGFTAPGSVQNVTGEQLALGALGANGGPTLTFLPRNSSIAVDAIPAGTNGCGTTVATDQRGVVRPQHGRCDIGAVEIPYRVPPRLISE